MKVDRGKYIKSELTGTVTLSSTHPILVMQYVSRYGKFMAAIPDVSHFAQKYFLFIADDQYVTNFVTIIIPTVYAQKLIFSETYVPKWIETTHVDLDGTEYFIGTTSLNGTRLHDISVYSAAQDARFGGIVAEGVDNYGSRKAFIH